MSSSEASSSPFDEGDISRRIMLPNSDARRAMRAVRSRTLTKLTGGASRNSSFVRGSPRKFSEGLPPVGRLGTTRCAYRRVRTQRT